MLLFIRQVWHLVLSLTQHLAANSTAHLQALVRNARNTLVWIRVIQIVPIILTVLMLALALVGDYLLPRTLGETASDRTGLLDVLMNGVSLALQSFILESVRRWLHAVSVSARGSKSLIGPKLSAMNGWTILWYLGLIGSLLGGLVGTFMLLRFPMTSVLRGRTGLDFTDLELFSRFNGLLQGGVILGLLLTVTAGAAEKVRSSQTSTLRSNQVSLQQDQGQHATAGRHGHAALKHAVKPENSSKSVKSRPVGLSARWSWGSAAA
ncbi:hypothetical protein [Deinococcus cavernae]|uniref:hypothetical protein n=1 Tax=Deinococcus cavernae TaxID=2320857 RepID=UPI0011C21446|nr:hypothetical protein [Deinococcus cavernae]